jgi:hypothetical protein
MLAIKLENIFGKEGGKLFSLEESLANGKVLVL